MIDLPRKPMVALFVLVVAFSALLVWTNPFSRDFVIRAGLIGAFGGILTAAYWDSNFRERKLWIWILIVVVLLVGGYYWSGDHAFGSSYRRIASFKMLMDYFLTSTTTLVGAMLITRWIRSQKSH